MEDLRTARIRAHRQNIRRYRRLLETQLTFAERQYLHKRIAQEQAELDRLMMSARRLAPSAPMVAAAAPA